MVMMQFDVWTLQMVSIILKKKGFITIYSPVTHRFVFRFPSVQPFDV